MSDPTVFIDFTFGFKSGEVQSITAEQKRDEVKQEGDWLIVETRPDAQTIETLEVRRDSLDYQRTIQRTVAVIEEQQSTAGYAIR